MNLLAKIKKDQFVHQLLDKMIGLFLGETEFPKLIIKKLKKKKIKYIIIDLTKKNIFKKDKNSNHISIGQFGKILTFLYSKNFKSIKKR